jgi:hypothetical protein
MENEFRYRSQVITRAQVEFIRQLIAQHPGANDVKIDAVSMPREETATDEGVPHIVKGEAAGSQAAPSPVDGASNERPGSPSYGGMRFRRQTRRTLEIGDISRRSREPGRTLGGPSWRWGEALRSA